MGGKHRGKKHGNEYLHTEYHHCSHSPKHQGDKKRECAECQPLAQVLAQMVHINLYSRQKHQIKDAHLTEHLKTHVAREQSEAVRTHSHSCQYQPYHVRDFQAVEQQRCHQDYRHNCQEYGHRRCNHGGLGRYREIQQHDTTKLVKNGEFPLRI